MIVSKVLLKDLIAYLLKQENGLNKVLEFTLNEMMTHERSLHLESAAGNKANGYRPDKSLRPRKTPGAAHTTRPK